MRALRCAHRRHAALRRLRFLAPAPCRGVPGLRAAIAGGDNLRRLPCAPAAVCGDRRGARLRVSGGPPAAADQVWRPARARRLGRRPRSPLYGNATRSRHATSTPGRIGSSRSAPPRRQRERGFNQATEIAARVGRATALPLAAALARVSSGPPQAALPWTARRSNVRGAFVTRAEVRGARIALVDDVMTTGATLAEAARTLVDAGAARVECWVVARTLPPAPAELGMAPPTTAADSRSFSSIRRSRRTPATSSAHREHRDGATSHRAARLPDGRPRAETRRARLSRIRERSRASRFRRLPRGARSGASAPLVRVHDRRRPVAVRRPLSRRATSSCSAANRRDCRATSWRASLRRRG